MTTTATAAKTRRLFKTLPVEQITKDDLNYNSDEGVAKYKAERTAFVGCVLAVRDDEGTVQVMSDVWDTQYTRTVTVWDAAKGCVRTMVTDTDFAYSRSGERASAWEVDATPEAVANYNKWMVEVGIPQDAASRANDTRRKQWAALTEEVNAILCPKPQRGQVWEVVKGRKFAKGTRGKLFWYGTNQWGESFGLATSDRKDEKGRNLDAIFVASGNLAYVPTDEDNAKVALLRQEIAGLDAYETRCIAKFIEEKMEAFEPLSA
jgi:hypothetical protein